MKNVIETAELTGVRFHLVNHSQLLNFIETSAIEEQKTNIFNVNIHAMNLAHKHPEFKSILNQADMVFVDGFGVILGAKLANIPVGQRLTPMDWIDDLFILCAKYQWKIFLLGDVDKALKEFEEKLKINHPHCQLVGYHHGFFDREGTENDKVVEIINQSGANILLIGMSMPIQEEWVWKNSDSLVPTIRITTGAMHRVYTENIRRAPQWATNNGFEWLYRLCMEPKKTWRRYILGNPAFILRVLRKKIFPKQKNDTSKF